MSAKAQPAGRRPWTTAPVVVRRRLPWSVRVVAAMLVVFAIVAGEWIAGSRRLVGEQASTAKSDLSDEVEKLRQENNALRAQNSASDHRMAIEQSTHASLIAQLKTLSDENALLKEDLAFFQTLMNSGESGREGITISRFRIRPGGLPGEYRYQLLVTQVRTRGREFEGHLQFVVDLNRSGQHHAIVIPNSRDASKDFDLSFKFYKRVEGSLRLPPEAKVTRVQVRVFERGADSPRSSQTVVLS